MCNFQYYIYFHESKIIFPDSGSKASAARIAGAISSIRNRWSTKSLDLIVSITLVALVWLFDDGRLIPTIDPRPLYWPKPDMLDDVSEISNTAEEVK